MNVVSIISVLLVVAVAYVLVLASVKPATFSLKRSTSIKASPGKIAPFISDFHLWGAWSPWEKIDADLQRSFSGAESGVGAVYAWEGKKAGSGRMEILESTPAAVVIKLDFIKPMKAHNTAIFTMEPSGDSTAVTWEMKGHNNFVAKVFQVFMDMDKMVGKSFEEGLASLKAAAEAA